MFTMEAKKVTRIFVVAKLDSSENPSASKTVEENIAKIAGALKLSLFSDVTTSRRRQK